MPCRSQFPASIQAGWRKEYRRNKEAQPDPLSRLGLLIFSNMSLPVAAEIHRRPLFHGEHRNPIDLLAIRGAAIVLPPRCLLRVPQQVRPGDMMVMADFGTAHPGKEFFRPIRAS